MCVGGPNKRKRTKSASRFGPPGTPSARGFGRAYGPPGPHLEETKSAVTPGPSVVTVARPNWPRSRPSQHRTSGPAGDSAGSQSAPSAQGSLCRGTLQIGSPLPSRKYSKLSLNSQTWKLFMTIHFWTAFVLSSGSVSIRTSDYFVR